MNRQRLILFILLIIFVVAVIWSYIAFPRPKTVSSLTYKPGQHAKPEALSKENRSTVTDDGTVLKISQLDSEASIFKGYRRNIFKPVFFDEMKIMRQKTVAVKVPPPKVPIVPVVPTGSSALGESVIVQPEAATLARFTFLGYLKKGAVKTIFLAKEKDIFLVKTGDKIAGRYEATDISDQALTLTVTDTGDEIVIPLVENRPLAAAK
jgi:hypothetical protein